MAAAAEKSACGGRSGVRISPRCAIRRGIVAVIASSEFKLKYSGSVLGYVWSMLKPLGLFWMLYVVFGHIFKLGNGSLNYPV